MHAVCDEPRSSATGTSPPSRVLWTSSASSTPRTPSTFQDRFAGPFGYSQKFGLVWTDFVTQQMTPKQSAYWYRDVVSRNGLM